MEPPYPRQGLGYASSVGRMEGRGGCRSHCEQPSAGRGDAEIRSYGPDNSTVVTDNPCIGEFNASCYGNGGELAEYALTVNAEMDYDISNGTIGNWTADDSWEWVLHIWNARTKHGSH